MDRCFPAVAMFVGLVVLCGSGQVLAAEPDPQIVNWVQDDAEGLRLLLRAMPLERQDIDSLIARLAATARTEHFTADEGRTYGIKRGWSVQEQRLGFGASHVELVSGREGCHARATLLVFEQTLAHYEIEVSCGERWPAVRQTIVGEWLRSARTEFTESTNGLTSQRAFDAVLDRYRHAVAAKLGDFRELDVPARFAGDFARMTSPLVNSMVSTRGCGMASTPVPEQLAIQAMVASGRVDLLENMLRGYNPGGRMYAAVALMNLRDSVGLRPEVEATLRKVLDLDADIKTCSGCIGQTLTARAALASLVTPRDYPGR